ncbi:hypothetical protein VB796_06460 [Arcicella sp. LKC2W]|uniref:hypothetical protein n=1 Tax=Arcicella sp. LKC2W TaxID=2984198 RepID=UPI002B203A2F|nr:hypothetical protein [Arcicella sp. LKC2W]MEA5458669.1 hypothetical protein [Arcicella sp. LKC2W]
MTNSTNTPLYLCDSLPHLGGFSRLRIAYSKDIVQQQLKSETELERIVFLKLENWIADYQYSDKFTGDYKAESSVADYGVDEKYAFKTIHETDTDPKDFKDWYEKKVRHRRFVLEITNNNGFVRRLNPFFITYTYIGTADFGQINRYELTFTRTILIDNLQGLSNNTIKSIIVDCNAKEPSLPAIAQESEALVFTTKTEYQ